jgi:hypothetical protein
MEYLSFSRISMIILGEVPFGSMRVPSSGAGNGETNEEAALGNETESLDWDVSADLGDWGTA